MQSSLIVILSVCSLSVVAATLPCQLEIGCVFSQVPKDGNQTHKGKLVFLAQACTMVPPAPVPRSKHPPISSYMYTFLRCKEVTRQ